MGRRGRRVVVGGRVGVNRGVVLVDTCGVLEGWGGAGSLLTGRWRGGVMRGYVADGGVELGC